MIKRDFHGTFTAEALREVEIIIGEVRMSGTSQQAQFITGFGAIRGDLFKLLQSYSLEPSYQLGNEGVIVVTID